MNGKGLKDGGVEDWMIGKMEEWKVSGISCQANRHEAHGARGLSLCDTLLTFVILFTDLLSLRFSYDAESREVPQTWLVGKGQ